MEDHWQWRLRMAEQLASELDGAAYGVAALYLIGSTKNATAGPGSDIDLIVHFRGTPQQEKELQAWMQAWSLRFAEENRLRTGFQSDGLLDVHMITDEDLRRKTSYAVMIGGVSDAARPLQIKTSAAMK